jgi:hypothetical protein
MKTSGRRNLLRYSLSPQSFFFTALLLTSFLLLSLNQAVAQAGEKPTPPPSNKKSTKSKPATVTKTKAPNKEGKRKSLPSAAAITQDHALASFETFTVEWMTKLAQTEEFQRTQRMQVNQASEGFTAEYIGYLPQRYIVVKKTASKDTPFVGILTYYEKILRCVGKTKEEATKGPVNQADTRQVSEIFRFTKGKWVY